MKTKIYLRSISISLILLINVLICLAQIPADFTYWKFNSGAYYNAPLIKDSVIYCGSTDSRLYAIDLRTGTEIWNYKTEFEISSTPAIQDDIICVVAGCKLYVLNIKTGELHWEYVASDAVPDLGNPTGYHRSSPVIYKDVVYFGDEWGNINGVHILTGELAFQYSIDTAYTDVTDYFIRTKPAIKDDIIYFGDHGARVYAISLIDSTEKWIHTMHSPRWDGSLVSDVVIRDSSVYIGGYNNVFSPLDIKTGKPRWEFIDENTFLPSTPVFYKDHIILGTTISSNHIYCLNAATGAICWNTKVKGIFFTKPVFINDSIVVMNSTDPFSDKVGVLYFMNCNNGAVINQMYLDNSTESYPVISGDKLFLGKNDGMYALDYKPYLVENNTSNIEFDDEEVNVIVNQNEILNVTYPILNNSNFCDSISVVYSFEGDDAKNNIKGITLTKRLLIPSKSTNTGFRASKDVLNPGQYTIRIQVYSYLNPAEPLFEKKTTVTVNEIDDIDENNSSGFNLYPNPYKTSVTFTHNKFSTSKVMLSVYSITGSLIYSHVFENKNGKIVWQGLDSRGKEISNGTYLYSLSSDKFQLHGKLLKLK